jgi:hypothetical protein
MKKFIGAFGLGLLLATLPTSAEVTRTCEVDRVPKEVTFYSGKDLNAKLRAKGRKATYESNSLWVTVRMNTSLLMFLVDDVKLETGDLTPESWRSLFIGQAKITANNDDWGRIVIVARKSFNWVDEEENARLGRKKQN